MVVGTAPAFGPARGWARRRRPSHPPAPRRWKVDGPRTGCPLAHSGPLWACRQSSIAQRDWRDSVRRVRRAAGPPGLRVSAAPGCVRNVGVCWAPGLMGAGSLGSGIGGLTGPGIQGPPASWVTGPLGRWRHGSCLSCATDLTGQGVRASQLSGVTRLTRPKGHMLYG